MPAFFVCDFCRRCLLISTAKEQNGPGGPKAPQQINDAIRDREVRVVSDDGEQLGIMPAAQALRLAESRNLDLVKIAPQAKPPVVKIMDYGKFRFEQSRREKDARKNQRMAELKAIEISVGIAQHDLDFKVGHALRFLEDGHKVKVFIKLRGRQMAHSNLAHDRMKEFAEACAQVAAVERPSKLEGRQVMMFLTPKEKPNK